jgi:hypothetical protein
VNEKSENGTPSEFFSLGLSMRNERRLLLFSIVVIAVSLTHLGRALPGETSGVSMSSSAAAAPSRGGKVKHPASVKHRLATTHHRSRLTGASASWGAVAVSLENDGASSGYARRSNAAEAINAAVANCAQFGRPGCYAPIAAFTSCVYVAISADGSSYSAFGTGGTPAQAVDNCQSRGVSCTAAVGGC